ncbi:MULTISPECIES: hypothetical protein [Fischerella]|uniref:hypothetical protein n=1 Tax=Fischerella TaxID=1190 RepID=UPI0015B9511D|nr:MULTISPECIES: hypothetical protein [Fischerella]
MTRTKEGDRSPFSLKRHRIPTNSNLIDIDRIELCVAQNPCRDALFEASLHSFSPDV